MKIFKEISGFEWDKGNKEKNLQKHCVTDEECEEIFFDIDKRILRDAIHSNNEARYILIGQTKRKRLLFTVFTVRNKRIRIISARDLNKKERNLYEKRT